MVSIDFVNDTVYQRCWDKVCRSCWRHAICLQPLMNVLDQLENTHYTNSSSKTSHSLMIDPSISCYGKVSPSGTHLKDYTHQHSFKYTTFCNASCRHYKNSTRDSDSTLFSLSKDRDRRLSNFDVRFPDDMPLHLLALQSM